MRDMIRSGNPGRFSFAIIIFLVSTAICLGQESPPAAKQEAAQAATTPPVTEDKPKVPDAVPAKPQEPPTAQIIAEPAPTKGKGRSSKKGKDAGGGGTGTGVSFTDVQTKPYEIGPEDILFLNVLHQPDVTGSLEVKPDGFVSVRFAGEIKAAGMTTSQLADDITEKLTKYFNHPEVNIQVVKILSKKYYINGEVRKSGAFSLSTPKTVFEAIIEAGGLAEFAKKKGIYILRGKDQKISFNYSDVSKGRHLEQNILLQNGDVIVVP